MKNINYFGILFCINCMVFSASCDKSDMQKAQTKIEERSHCIDDCTDCPPADCCCSIQILTDPGALVDLNFCGTSGDCASTMPCSVEDLQNCADINGYTETISFTNQFQTELFCVPQNASFGITSATAGQHQVRLTCQLGQTSPTYVTFTLNNPPNKPYWSTNSECLLTSCN